MSLLIHLASRAAPVVDLEAEMDHRLQDMASRYMFATNAEMNTGLDREMADLGVGIRKNAARRQERKGAPPRRRSRLDMEKAITCVSACKFDPMRRGIGVQLWL